ncbi:hypothetical protein CapIbe_020165 [Capra ibex]
MTSALLCTGRVSSFSSIRHSREFQGGLTELSCSAVNTLHTWMDVDGGSLSTEAGETQKTEKMLKQHLISRIRWPTRLVTEVPGAPRTFPVGGR